jgi:heme exporter protein D
MNGMVSGGWQYVWAAYGVTAVVIFSYAARTVARLRSLQ